MPSIIAERGRFARKHPDRKDSRAKAAGHPACSGASQFPTFFQRTIDFAHWHLDAERRPGVAGVSHDGLLAVARAVGFASQFPVFLVAPIGGIVADRHNRHRVVIATQVASMILALILAGLTLTGVVTVREIFALAILLGVVNAFDIPGRQSFIVDMVGKEHLMNAIALNSSMFNAARIIGPAVAGIMVARIGEGWCFFANGVSYIAVIVGLFMMRVHCAARPSKHSPIE